MSERRTRHDRIDTAIAKLRQQWPNLNITEAILGEGLNGPVTMDRLRMQLGRCVSIWEDQPGRTIDEVVALILTVREPKAPLNGAALRAQRKKNLIRVVKRRSPKLSAYDRDLLSGSLRGH